MLKIAADFNVSVMVISDNHVETMTLAVSVEMKGILTMYTEWHQRRFKIKDVCFYY